MSKTLLESSLQPARVDIGWSSPRIVVCLQDDRDGDSLIGLLAADGLGVSARAVTLRRIDELVADAPDALVLAGDPQRLELLAALRRARRKAPGTRIVVVTAGSDHASPAARQTLNAGADAFVPRRDADRSLAPAVRAVLAGLVCAPRETRRALAKPTFSHREKEVLALLVTGLTNQEIASRLFLAESTVKSHLISAFGKLGVRSRKDATAILLDPAEGLAAVSLAYATPPSPGR
jgi:DNA-binding NarL/FixJ family response regulator